MYDAAYVTSENLADALLSALPEGEGAIQELSRELEALDMPLSSHTLISEVLIHPLLIGAIARRDAALVQRCVKFASSLGRSRDNSVLEALQQRFLDRVCDGRIRHLLDDLLSPEDRCNLDRLCKSGVSPMYD